LVIEMPVVPSILVSICCNIFAGILTVVGLLVLGVIFAGYLVTTTGKIAPGEGEEIQQANPFDSPTSPAMPQSPAGAKEPGDDDESSLDRPRDAGRFLWATLGEAGDSRFDAAVSSLVRSQNSASASA
jgi:hypothetical protein